MIKKSLNSTLHDTRNYPRWGSNRAIDRIVVGRVYVKKAHLWMSYKKFNKKGISDIEEWQL